MRILYDGSLTPHPLSGIQRYFTMIVSHLPRQAEVSCSSRSSREALRIGPHEVAAPPVSTFRPRRLSGLLDTACWAGKHFDLVHWMYYGPSQMGARLRRNGVPYVLTVHDLIHEIHGAPAGLLDRQARQESYTSASAILCVSNHTRNDLLAQYDVPPEKTHVIHHGSNMQPSEGADTDLPDGPKYFLHVGSRSGYKNFSSLLPVLQDVRRTHPDIQLRLAGPSLNSTEREIIRTYGLEDVVVEEGHVRDGRLASLYAHSVALLHPSLHEGFGIPLLEAMDCGTIPIATASTSVPEVLGDAGNHVHPDNMEAGFREAMLDLLGNPDQRDSKAKECRKRSKAFNWEMASRKTFEVYQEAIGS